MMMKINTCTLGIRTNTDDRKHDDKDKYGKLDIRANTDDRKHDDEDKHM